MCFAPQRRALFRHFFDIRTSKSGPRPSVFNTFDLEMCFAPQRRALFFDIWTAKSGPTLVCFVHFDFKMCFAPQRRALFRHRNFQKWSDHGVFCTFWAKHILKSKCTKHRNLGPLLEVEMLKKCTPLWREAHFEVKSVKNWRSRTTFGGSDVEKVSKKCTPLRREAHFEVKSVKNWEFWAFFDMKMSKK